MIRESIKIANGHLLSHSFQFIIRTHLAIRRYVTYVGEKYVGK